MREAGSIDVAGTTRTRLYQRQAQWNRTQLFAASVQFMAQILVDIACTNRSPRVTALNDALTRLDDRAPLDGQVMKMLFLGRLSVGDAAAMLKVSEAEVRAAQRRAGDWLSGELRGLAQDPGRAESKGQSQ